MSFLAKIMGSHFQNTNDLITKHTEYLCVHYNVEKSTQRLNLGLLTMAMPEIHNIFQLN